MSQPSFSSVEEHRHHHHLEDMQLGSLADTSASISLLHFWYTLEAFSSLVPTSPPTMAFFPLHFPDRRNDFSTASNGSPLRMFASWSSSFLPTQSLCHCLCFCSIDCHALCVHALSSALTTACSSLADSATRER